VAGYVAGRQGAADLLFAGLLLPASYFCCLIAGRPRRALPEGCGVTAFSD